MHASRAGPEGNVGGHMARRSPRPLAGRVVAITAACVPPSDGGWP
jgi:hypothetical protein